MYAFMCLSHGGKHIFEYLSEYVIDFGKFFFYRKGRKQKKWVMRQIKTYVLNGICKELECFREGGINIYYIPTRLNINLLVAVF